MSTTIDQQDTTTHGGAAPAELGVGMRLSIHPHCDDFVDVVLGALADVEAQGLTDGLVVETDDVSTYVGARQSPAEQGLAAYATGLLAAASARSGGGHVVAHVLLSRGCPGEVACDLAVTGLPTAAPVELAPTGVQASAQWSLYPLLDTVTHPASTGGGDDGDDDRAGQHMAWIEDAIDGARRRGVAGPAAHYATPLRGDVADVVATAVDAWAQVGAHVPHVVSHLTVSVGSPSAVQA